MSTEAAESPEALPGAVSRPQSVMFSFLGIYVLGTGSAVYSGSVIDMFDRIGVSEDAVRSTLARMVKRGLLARHRQGRKMYFGLTPQATAVLRDGHRRIWETGVVNRAWDGTWTLAAFSMPDTQRSKRHDLRSRLIWSRFGPLQSGLWIAAGHQDVAAIAEELGIRAQVTVLRGRADSSQDDGDLVRRAFDLEAIADRYHAFLERWDTGTYGPEGPGALGQQLLLHTDWLQLVRRDPLLPAALLPGDWPAIPAESRFRLLAERLRGPAQDEAEELLEVRAVDEAPSA